MYSNYISLTIIFHTSIINYYSEVENSYKLRRFQFNPMLTYTIRFKNLTMYPNISGEITIDQFREKQFINGNVTIDTKLYINRVSNQLFYGDKENN